MGVDENPCVTETLSTEVTNGRVVNYIFYLNTCAVIRVRVMLEIFQTTNF